MPGTLLGAPDNGTIGGNLLVEPGSAVSGMREMILPRVGGLASSFDGFSSTSRDLEVLPIEEELKKAGATRFSRPCT